LSKLDAIRRGEGLLALSAHRRIPNEECRIWTWTESYFSFLDSVEAVFVTDVFLSSAAAVII